MARKGEADPRAVLEELTGRTSSGLDPGYVLRGEELFFKNRALDSIKAAAQSAGHEVCLHDTGESGFRASAVLDDLQGGALFAAQRLVCIQRPEPILKKDGSKPSATTRAITAFVQAGAGSVVLLCEGLRADHAVVKAIQKAGGAVWGFRKLYDRAGPWDKSGDPRRIELVQWILQAARERKVKLGPEHAMLLVAASGNDLAALDLQLEGLRHGAGREIFDNLERGAPGAPFELAGDIAKGSLSGGLSGVEHLFRLGHRGRDGKREVQPEALKAVLFNALRGKLRQGVAGSRAIAAGASPGEAAKLAGVPSYPMALREFEDTVGARSVAQWAEMARDLAGLELKTRTSVPVDENDFALFALRWAHKPSAKQRTGGRTGRPTGGPR